MKIQKLFPLIFLTCLVSSTQAQVPSIWLDGEFTDWTSSAPGWTDASGDGSPIDLLSFQVSNDENYLFIRFQMAQTITLNSGNNLFLEIDADNNAQTGYSVNGIGAEMAWKFGGRYGYFNLSTGSISIDHGDIGFKALPTVTSSIFELAIDRSAKPDNQNDLFTGDTIKICFVDQSGSGDKMPDPGNEFTYVFDNTASSTFVPVDPNKADSSHIRILSYNTLQDGITDISRQAAFQRIFQFANPDIVTLNECWNTQYYEVENLLDTWLPITGSSWDCWKIDAGNITCSRFPITQNWKILPDRRLTASLINLPVWYSKDLLLTNAHFKCCNGDSIRQREADGYIHFIKDAQTIGGVIDVENGTPFILCGDLNLVGDTQQLKTLVYGDIVDTSQFGSPGLPDWNQQPFIDHIAYQNNEAVACTWSDYGSSYWPGRLDFVISSQTNLNLEKTFILNTAILSSQQLSNYGLLATDSETASDHFPKISDISIPLILDIQEEKPGLSTLKPYPNPARNSFSVESPAKDALQFTVYNSIGQIILVKQFDRGKQIRINSENWPAGIYMLIARNRSKNMTGKIEIEK